MPSSRFDTHSLLFSIFFPPIPLLDLTFLFSVSMGPRSSVNGPLIIAISVGLAIVAFVVLVWIIRWSKRKPKLPPPPRRATAYWANPPPHDDDESKMAYDRPRPYGPGEATDSSQVSLWRGPDGEYYTTTPPTTGELRMDESEAINR